VTSWRYLTMHAARDLADRGELDLDAIDRAIRSAISGENPALGSYTQCLSAGAKPQAVPGSTAHALAGFGVAIKANIAGTGWRTDCGSRILKEYSAPYDATVVARLRRAGARFLGVTAMDEFGMGSSCEYSAWGEVHNPWHPDRTPGGSSGGSAAAVAAGLAWYALGSDTGGSVRLPAHCCGIVGLKPTWGRVSRYGLTAFASSLDTIGVLARDVKDAAQVYSAIAGPDPLDATSLPVSPGDPVAALTGLPRRRRIGVPRDFVRAAATPAVIEDLERVLAGLSADGAEIVSVDLPGLEAALATYTVISCAEAASNLARFDGTFYGARQPGSHYAAMVAETRSVGFGPEVKRRILLGTHVLADGYREQFYLRACRARQGLVTGMTALFRDIDALALPTAPTAAFALGSRLADPIAMYGSDVFTVPASLAGLPALTVPTGLDTDGLPLSVQLVGPACGEDYLLQLGAAVEERIRFRELKEAPWQRPL